jgi:hypothetical protein
MDSIPKFTPADIETVRQLVHQKYQEMIQVQLADSELMLDPKREQPVSRPTLFWHVHGANFAVILNGLNRFQCQFFYTPHDQYGTGREEYDSLEQCVTTLLQVQANHERDHGLS